MIGAATKTTLSALPILEAVKKAAYRNIGHAAASLRKDIRSSIETSPAPSQPGKPPHTRRGTFLRRAVLYAYDRKAMEAVIGPAFSVVGTVGKAHEFGGLYKGADFPERPFELPALYRNLDRFASDWAGSAGE